MQLYIKTNIILFANIFSNILAYSKWACCHETFGLAEFSYRAVKSNIEIPYTEGKSSGGSSLHVSKVEQRKFLTGT